MDQILDKWFRRVTSKLIKLVSDTEVVEMMPDRQLENKPEAITGKNVF